MMPVRKATVVDFLEWVRKNHPHIRSLLSLEEDQFMRLATDYEISKTASRPMRRGDELYAKWNSAFMFFRGASNDKEALERYPS
jgi:hypothetical protein